MTVIELIKILDDMPHNSQVMFTAPLDTANAETIPNPQMEWDDENGKYVVLL